MVVVPLQVEAVAVSTEEEAPLVQAEVGIQEAVFRLAEAAAVAVDRAQAEELHQVVHVNW